MEKSMLIGWPRAPRTGTRGLGGRHPLSCSLPATAIFPMGPSVVSLRIHPTAIDRVPGNVATGAYDALPFEFATLQISVPKAIFGYHRFCFQSSKLVSTAQRTRSIRLTSRCNLYPWAPRSCRTRRNHAIRRSRIELVWSM